MPLEQLSAAKQTRMRALSTARGTIEAMAVDQRKSLRRLIAEGGSTSLESVSDAQLATFKTAVAEVLSPYASAVLFDPEYGLGAAQARAKECGLLLAYEADGYENPRPNRMLALMPRLSVRRLRDMGADGIKILLHYTPEDTSAVNEEKCALIERIGNECRALDMPFFFEPIVYDPAVPAMGAKQTKDEKFEFAKRKPAIVIKTMREFSKDIYHIDILKVEFPVVARMSRGAPRTRARQPIQWIPRSHGIEPPMPPPADRTSISALA